MQPAGAALPKSAVMFNRDGSVKIPEGNRGSAAAATAAAMNYSKKREAAAAASADEVHGTSGWVFTSRADQLADVLKLVQDQLDSPSMVRAWCSMHAHHPWHVILYAYHAEAPLLNHGAPRTVRALPTVTKLMVLDLPFRGVVPTPGGGLQPRQLEWQDGTPPRCVVGGR